MRFQRQLVSTDSIKTGLYSSSEGQTIQVKTEEAGEVTSASLSPADARRLAENLLKLARKAEDAEAQVCP